MKPINSVQGEKTEFYFESVNHLVYTLSKMHGERLVMKESVNIDLHDNRVTKTATTCQTSLLSEAKHPNQLQEKCEGRGSTNTEVLTRSSNHGRIGREQAPFKHQGQRSVTLSLNSRHARISRARGHCASVHHVTAHVVLC